MASNWRYGIAERGLVGTGLLLIARLVPGQVAQEFVGTTSVGLGSGVLFDLVSLPDGSYGFANQVPFSVFDNFPFGLAVEPD